MAIATHIMMNVKVCGNYCKGITGTSHPDKCNDDDNDCDTDEPNRPVIKMVGLGPFKEEGVCSGTRKICHQGPARDD